MSSGADHFTGPVLAVFVKVGGRKVVATISPFGRCRDARTARWKMARRVMAGQGMFGALRDSVTSMRQPDLRGFGTNRTTPARIGVLIR